MRTKADIDKVSDSGPLCSVTCSVPLPSIHRSQKQAFDRKALSAVAPRTPYCRHDRKDRSGAPKVSAILGPTNTGKTFFAIERMLAHKSGMIGLPLRLLAREVYDRIVRLNGVRAKSP